MGAGGPLRGVVVTEMAGIGPAPFCGMVLADLGAEVIRFDRVDRTEGITHPELDLTNRGKLSIAVDLKTEGAAEVVLRSVARSDALIEGFRPGVAERLGIGPAECLARNPGLVYGRVTGWGQEGPLSGTAGHDIDYIALSGVLHMIGPADHPIPPLNLVGDYGGGAMLLAVGLMAGIISSRFTGRGQVVDAAMVDGSALLTTAHHGYIAEGWWSTTRASNLLDGSAPFYTTYETSDGEHMAVGALEPRFFDVLVDVLGIEREDLPPQDDRDGWPEMRRRFAEVFRLRTRDEWAAQFAGTDACVAPVVSMSEAPERPHNVARGTFTTIDGVSQPAPAPRFSATPATPGWGPHAPGEDTDEVLTRLGFRPDEVSKLRSAGVVA